jgi:hypothetical protein
MEGMSFRVTKTRTTYTNQPPRRFLWREKENSDVDATGPIAGTMENLDYLTYISLKVHPKVVENQNAPKYCISDYKGCPKAWVSARISY